MQRNPRLAMEAEHIIHDSGHQHRQRRNRASDKKKIDAYRQTQSLPPPRDRNAYNNRLAESRIFQGPLKARGECDARLGGRRRLEANPGHTHHRDLRRPELWPMNILLMMRSRDSYRLVARMLCHLGQKMDNIIYVETLQELLAILERAQKGAYGFHIILVDSSYSPVNASRVAAKIKHTWPTNYPEVPGLLVEITHPRKGGFAAPLAHFDDTVEQPFTMRELIRVLYEVVHTHQLARAKYLVTSEP
mmetsp:Transcript_13844/g.26549  ORF Transcript_13844/g.26549 Transcript_13844/m.26549 type:complete len:247 (+) Transcript_13844:902-1642(+)